MADTRYRVAPGDCMASIAAQSGFTWQSLWNLPENQQLKDLRENPNVLMEGDEVYIPSRRVKEVPCATEQNHVFVRKGVPSKLRLRLLAYGRPRTTVRYVLDAGSASFEGQPDPDGYIEATIPPGLKSARLIVFDEGVAEEHTLRLGYLDPLEEVRGIQQRLLNLGLECTVTGELDEQTKVALQNFQQQEDLPGDGELSDETRNQLQKLHGA